jgi:hypothetical protein
VGNSAVARLLADGATGGSLRAGEPGQVGYIQRHEPAKVVEERNAVAAATNLKPEQLVELLSKSASNIEALGSTIWNEADEAAIQEEYAKDKAVRTGDNSPGAKASAIQEWKDNQGRGFAAQDGKIWMLAGVYAKSDLLHEFIHILSGSGGATKVLEEIGSSFNEGMTQYFAEEICDKTGGTKKPAYPYETEFAKSLATKHGLTTLYDAYFGGGVDGFVTKLATQYSTYLKSGTLADATKAGAGEKQDKDDLPKLKGLVLAKLKNFKGASEMTWLKKRVL